MTLEFLPTPSLLAYGIYNNNNNNNDDDVCNM